MAAVAGGNDHVAIHLFPTRLTVEGLKAFSAGVDNDLATFWKNLQLGFAAFEKNRTLPKVSVNTEGRYIIS